MNKNRYQFLTTLAYDGARFFGVQEQVNLPTVLGALRQRIKESSKEEARCLIASARTDRGVSALNNYATFYLKELAPERINNFIKDVQEHRDDGLYNINLEWVDYHVHARQCSGSKIYRYTIIDADKGTSSLAWSIAPKLNIQAMKEAALLLIGEQDFSSLRGGGCEAGSVIKEIYSINITRCESGEILIDIHGNAFLRKMIRNLVGLLVEVGAGLRSPNSVGLILSQKNRQAAGIMAQAQGLCLMSVALQLPSGYLLKACSP
jgi:tRNA pseudouridine38-40 synthase